MVSVTIEGLKIVDTHTNRYLGNCAPDITVIPIGYGVSEFNAVMVMELQVGLPVVVTRGDLAGRSPPRSLCGGK